MSSILTNNSAMSALSTLRNINSNLNETQGRISTGLKVQSAKDNASYFSISESMKGDSSMYKAINESLTLTKNSVATASLGADSFKDLATKFVERVAFAQENPNGLGEIEAELTGLVAEMKTTISQSTFNGDDLVNANFEQADGTAATAATIDAATGVVTGSADSKGDGTRSVVTGVNRSSGSLETTTIDVGTVDLSDLASQFEMIATGFETNGTAATGEAFLEGALKSASAAQSTSIDAATTLGLAEKSLENQQKFLTSLVDNLDAGVGAMVDANMEEEAARLQSLQVQQQLASQSLSIANQAPQNILSLFR